MSRSTAERIADARHRLETEPNIWLATSSATGDVHSIPLSLSWLDDRICVVAPAESTTARNIAQRSDVRAHLDSADDVLIIDGDASIRLLHETDPDVVERYIDRVGWSPFDSDNEWVLIAIEPRRVQSWRGPGEVDGRTIMRDGEWIGAR